MKKFQHFYWLLLAFIALQFSACEDQNSIVVLPGDDDQGIIIAGEFTAIVDELEFVSDSVSGVLSLDNVLVLTGINTISGERIMLSFENLGEGVFDITAGLGNQNSGSYLDPHDPLNPYTTDIEIGGSGELIITEYNPTLMTISGTFSFIGVKISIDPIGNTITETVEVNDGEFTKIPFALEEIVMPPLDDDFYALVDGIDFIPIAINTTLDTISSSIMLRIEAINENGAIIRIDIPEDLGIGEFNMVSLSNGTNLIGLYNANTGGENLTSNPGIIEITNFDLKRGNIQAMFSFKATDPIGVDPIFAEITEGSFDIDYKESGISEDSFDADIDEEAFNPDSLLIEESTFNEVAIYVITAINTETNQKIELFFPTEIKVGSYEMNVAQLEGSEIVGVYYPDKEINIPFSSSSGVFNLVEYNLEEGIISGTFSFSAIDTSEEDPTIYIISNGEFSFSIQ